MSRKKKKSQVKREIELTGLDVKLDVGLVVEIHTTGKNFIYLEEMPNGKWRLSYTGIVTDIEKLEALTILRSEKTEEN